MIYFFTPKTSAISPLFNVLVFILEGFLGFLLAVSRAEINCSADLLSDMMMFLPLLEVGIVKAFLLNKLVFFATYKFTNNNMSAIMIYQFLKCELSLFPYIANLCYYTPREIMEVTHASRYS